MQFHDEARKAELEAMDRQDFLKLQIKEMNARKRGSRNEDKSIINKNIKSLKQVDSTPTVVCVCVYTMR